MSEASERATQYYIARGYDAAKAQELADIDLKTQAETEAKANEANQGLLKVLTDFLSSTGDQIKRSNESVQSVIDVVAGNLDLPTKSAAFHTPDTTQPPALGSATKKSGPNLWLWVAAVVGGMLFWKFRKKF